MASPHALVSRNRNFGGRRVTVREGRLMRPALSLVCPVVAWMEGRPTLGGYREF